MRVHNHRIWFQYGCVLECNLHNAHQTIIYIMLMRMHFVENPFCHRVVRAHCKRCQLLVIRCEREDDEKERVRETAAAKIRFMTIWKLCQQDKRLVIKLKATRRQMYRLICYGLSGFWAGDATSFRSAMSGLCVAHEANIHDRPNHIQNTIHFQWNQKPI